MIQILDLGDGLHCPAEVFFSVNQAGFEGVWLLEQ
jgi:hypothetical protein